MDAWSYLSVLKLSHSTNRGRHTRGSTATRPLEPQLTLPLRGGAHGGLKHRVLNFKSEGSSGAAMYARALPLPPPTTRQAGDGRRERGGSGGAQGRLMAGVGLDDEEGGVGVLGVGVDVLGLLHGLRRRRGYKAGRALGQGTWRRRKRRALA